LNVMKKVLTLILAVAVIAGGVAVSRLYWQNQKTKTNNQSTNQNQKDPSESGKYLIIKEWNVKFEIPDQYRGDIYYGSYGENAIAIGSKQFEAFGERCGAGQDKDGMQKQGVAGIFRRPAGTPSPVGYPAFASLEGYDYYGAPSSGACVSDSKYFKDLTTIRDSLNSVIQQTLQPISPN
jgi:hypothetical protein